MGENKRKKVFFYNVTSDHLSMALKVPFLCIEVNKQKKLWFLEFALNITQSRETFFPSPLLHVWKAICEVLFIEKKKQNTTTMERKNL